jgi:hypothetical protein
VPDTNHSAGADRGIRSVPEGYHAVTPWIISRDTARLLDFVKEAFGAEEIARVPNEDGTIGHAEFRIGDSIAMAFDAREGWPDTPGFSACTSREAMPSTNGRLRPGPCR